MPVLPALLLVLAVAPPLPPAPRSPAASSTPAAQVVLVHGQAALPRGTTPLLLARGMLLDRTDVVSLREGAWVALLLLNNGHVVRLDDEMTIAVEKLALFKAGPVSEDAQAQLDRLLSRREKERLGSERLIGWHQGQVAANTRAAEAASSQEKEQAPRRVAADEGGPTGGGAAPAPKALHPAPRPPGSPPPAPAPAAEPPPPPPPAKLAVEPQRLKRGLGGGGPQRGQQQELAELADASSERKKEAPREEARSAGPKAKAAHEAPGLAVDAALSACVARVVTSAGAGLRQALGAQVTLRFRVRDDEVQVGTGGALPVDACLVEWATAHRAQLLPAWQPVVVPLK